MKKKNKNPKTPKKQSSIERENQKEQGFFDGRFSQKIVQNKKKKKEKYKKRRVEDYYSDDD